MKLACNTQIYFLLFLFAIIQVGCSSNQKDNFQVTVRQEVQRAVRNEPNLKPIISEWTTYLTNLQKNKADYQTPKNWADEKVAVADLPVYILCQETDFFAHHPHIENIQKIDSNRYIVKTRFDYGEPGKREVYALYNVIAEVYNGKVVFSGYHSYYTRNFKQQKIGDVTYLYPSSHVLNTEQAVLMNKYNQDFAGLFNTKAKSFSYYIYPNSEERFRAMGFDYNKDMFNSNQKTGEADLNNKIIHAGNGKEVYPHELAHLYTADYYDTIHRWFDEGLAVYLDQLEEKEHRTYLRAIKRHALDNPTYDFNDLLTLPDTIGGNASLKYDLSALLVKRITDKNKKDGLQAILKGGKTDEDFYKLIKVELGVNREDLDVYLRQELKTY